MRAALKRRRRKQRAFTVFFGGQEVGYITEATIQGALRKLGLVFCIGRKEPARHLCPGSALHGHVPKDRDDRATRTAIFPLPIGRVPYDLRFPLAPPVTLHEALPRA